MSYSAPMSRFCAASWAVFSPTRCSSPAYRLCTTGHAVEAARQHAEFVLALDRQAGAEFARRHALQAVAQAQHRRNDPQVQQVDHAARCRRRRPPMPWDSRSEVVLPALSCSIMRTSLSARATKSGSVRRIPAASWRAVDGAQRRRQHDVAPVVGHAHPVLADERVVEMNSGRAGLPRARRAMVSSISCTCSSVRAWRPLRAASARPRRGCAHAQAASVVDGRAGPSNCHDSHSVRLVISAQHHDQRRQRTGGNMRVDSRWRGDGSAQGQRRDRAWSSAGWRVGGRDGSSVISSLSPAPARGR